MKKQDHVAEIAALRWLLVRLAAGELRKAPLPKHAVKRFQSTVEAELAAVRQYAFAETTPKIATINAIDFCGELGRLCFDIADEALGE